MELYRDDARGFEVLEDRTSISASTTEVFEKTIAVHKEMKRKKEQETDTADSKNLAENSAQLSISRHKRFSALPKYSLQPSVDVNSCDLAIPGVHNLH